ncbi:MAG: cupin domain-containing protein [Hyphomonas sp.]
MKALSGDLGAREIIRLLNMAPHPEGGHYVETFQPRRRRVSARPSTLIHFLLQADEVSAWHRVDADEIWLWQAGGPLALTTSPPDAEGASAVTSARTCAGQPAGHRTRAALADGGNPRRMDTRLLLGRARLSPLQASNSPRRAGVLASSRAWRPISGTRSGVAIISSGVLKNFRK